MPHFILEIGRDAVERQLLATPIQLDDSGAPDILAPPFAISRTTTTPLSTMRSQIIVERVHLQVVPGSAQCSLRLEFDKGSIEILSAGASEGNLVGTIIVPCSLQFVSAPGAQVAELNANFTGTVAQFQFAPESKARLVAKVGQFLADSAEQTAGAGISAQFSQAGSQATGLKFNLTPGLPSEDLLTTDALPGIVWVDEETLAVSIEYAPAPPPFPVIPFLPQHQSSAFAARLSNDGFQRTVRNPAVRKQARDLLSARLLPDYVRNVFAERGGIGDPTDADRAEAAKRLDYYLATPPGLTDLANETPAPVGNGRLHKRVTHVPDPFSDFDAEIPELDLWLGHDRIEGRTKIQGTINGFGFTATATFRTRPVLITQPALRIEMHDLEMDDPDISIDLPWWLEWGVGIIVALLGGSALLGAIVAFILSSVISSLAEAFLPSDFGGGPPTPEPKRITGLPKQAKVSSMHVVPEYLELVGRWNVSLDDPKPFNPWVTIQYVVQRRLLPNQSQGVAWFHCLGVLGVLMDAKEGSGTPFQYTRQNWSSRVTCTLDAAGVPAPLRRSPWTLAIAHHSPGMTYALEGVTAAQILAPGTLTFTAEVWHPEPPLRGQVAAQTFSIDVQQPGEDQFILDVPNDAACIVLVLETSVIDADGVSWKPTAQVLIANQTVKFGDDFTEFTKRCAKGRHDYTIFKDPSLIDRIWNPPDVFGIAVERAILKGEPGVTDQLASLLSTRGVDGIHLVLAPSLFKGRQ